MVSFISLNVALAEIVYYFNGLMEILLVFYLCYVPEQRFRSVGSLLFAKYIVSSDYAINMFSISISIYKNVILLVAGEHGRWKIINVKWKILVRI